MLLIRDQTFGCPVPVNHTTFFTPCKILVCKPGSLSRRWGFKGYCSPVKTSRPGAITGICQNSQRKNSASGFAFPGFSYRKAGRNTFTKALATVTIEDASNNPISGVTVYGSWSGATSDADLGTTGTDGAITLESDEVKNAAAGTIFTFTVTDVAGQDWTYTPEANTETEKSVDYWALVNNQVIL